MSDDALNLAIEFHETYERLAPSFGYETRKETRAFDPSTPNGRLMVAVCGELLRRTRQEWSGPREIKYVKQRADWDCGIAVLAMVSGRDYESVLKDFGPEIVGHGIEGPLFDDWFIKNGYAIQCVPDEPKDGWAPWAPAHVCYVRTTAGAHVCVMDHLGRVFDPFDIRRKTLTHPDYKSVRGVIGVWKLPPPSPVSEASGEKDVDALTGCADDQTFADVDLTKLREVYRFYLDNYKDARNCPACGAPPTPTPEVSEARAVLARIAKNIHPSCPDDMLVIVTSTDGGIVSTRFDVTVGEVRAALSGGGE